MEGEIELQQPTAANSGEDTTTPIEEGERQQERKDGGQDGDRSEHLINTHTHATVLHTG